MESKLTNLKQWKNASLYEWRPFESQDLATLLTNCRVSTSANGSCYSVLGTSSGRVFVFNKEWNAVYSFTAIENGDIQLLKFVESGGILVIVGNDHNGRVLLQFWRIVLEHRKKSRPYKCVYEHSIHNISKPPHPATVLCVSNDLRTVFCGFSNGLLIAIYGNFLKDLGSQQRVLLKITEPITNFLLTTDITAIVTTFSSSYSLHLPSLKLSPLEFKGVGLNCCSRFSKDKFILSYKESLYVIDCFGRVSGRIKTPVSITQLGTCFGDVYILGTSKSDTEGANNEMSVLLLDIENKLIKLDSHLPTISCFLSQRKGTFVAVDQQKTLRITIKRNHKDVYDSLADNNQVDLAYFLAHYLREDKRLLQTFALRCGQVKLKEKKFVEAVDYFICAIPRANSVDIADALLHENQSAELVRYLEQLLCKNCATEDDIKMLLYLVIELNELDLLRKYISNKMFPSTAVVIPILFEFQLYQELELLAITYNLSKLMAETLMLKESYTQLFDYLVHCSPLVIAQIIKKYGYSLLQLTEDAFSDFLFKLLTNRQLFIQSHNCSDDSISFVDLQRIFCFRKHNLLDLLRKLKSSESMTEDYEGLYNHVLLESFIIQYCKSPDRSLEEQAVSVIRNHNSTLDVTSFGLLMRGIGWTKAMRALSLKTDYALPSPNTIVEYFENYGTLKLDDIQSADDSLSTLEQLVSVITEETKPVILTLAERCLSEYRISLDKVIHVLEKCSFLSLCDVTSLCTKWISHFNEVINENEVATKKLQAETEHLQEEIEHMTEADKLCDICGTPLKYSFSAYSCKHIVHAFCGQAEQCPTCGHGMLENENDFSTDPDMFYELLETTKQKDSFLAQSLSRNCLI
ncbi:zinc finger protein Pep5/Vps11-like protein [Schizosaccharomyces japonicus yFS275]|uniref:Zinc finger protein Pep5/Vps11-like protein n=1 Tax=Schizosaccharomyces japonicus (strain yFS275 / FY16936) TaxID=402676 RepID=B6JYV2_SCHJY|nr:zinc finger protein Pep5/Vps11-like protein [Schizosaccharomyces japonicus yFS275]EEB06720.2 zinc finger protein Pep5/Vps11-like protein [Schizosaccharomyces japonicus yFS275]